jgi:hypothetical protein
MHLNRARKDTSQEVKCDRRPRIMTWLSALLEPLRRWRALHPLRSMEKRKATDHHWEFENLVIQAQDVLDRGQTLSRRTPLAYMKLKARVRTVPVLPSCS